MQTTSKKKKKKEPSLNTRESNVTGVVFCENLVNEFIYMSESETYKFKLKKKQFNSNIFSVVLF